MDNKYLSKVYFLIVITEALKERIVKTLLEQLGILQKNRDAFHIRYKAGLFYRNHYKKGLLVRLFHQGGMHMAIYKDIRPVKVFMGKLAHGADLWEELTDICIREEIRLGRIEAFGAVQKAKLGFYHQKTRNYESFALDRPLEITKLIGNISLKEGKPMVHAHVTLADKDGSAYGGHLMPGTIIFACEFLIQVFEGPIFNRKLDEQTGLPLWEMDSTIE
jgi:predicted DNA-binding protein with PD1-like motif